MSGLFRGSLDCEAVLAGADVAVEPTILSLRWRLGTAWRRAPFRPPAPRPFRPWLNVSWSIPAAETAVAQQIQISALHQ